MSTKTTKRKRASAAAPEAAADPAALLESPQEQPAVAPPAESVAPTASTSSTVSLSSNCTVKDAGVLKEQLLRLLDEPSVAIDAKSVERMDTATLQLLCAFVRDRADRNLPVAWGAIPQTLREAARLLGVGALLALPAEAAP